MPLKVTNVERFTVTVPFTQGQRPMAERTVYNWSVFELCKVTTDAGLVGWGETIVHYIHARVTDQSVQRVMGKSPADFMQDDTIGAGLQMALYDVVGKALEVPCHKLLGSKVRDWVPISWWSNEGPPDDWVRQVRDAVDNGYTTIKLKQRPWHDIHEQMTEIDANVPRHFRVDLDANGSMHNAATAMPVMRGLEGYDIVAMFETPIPQTDILGNRQLRQVISRPIAMHFGSPPYTTAIREAVCDGFVVSGGATRVRYQGILSAEANMPFWLQMVGNGLTTTWAAHLGAVLTHATWPAITCINLYRHHLLKHPIEVVGGFHRVPDGPGLGVEVDEEAMHGFLVPDDVMRPFLDRDEPYDFPRPRFIRTAVFPDGHRVHFGNIRHGWELEAYTPGIRTEYWREDGTAEFEDLWRRTRESPVTER